MRRFKPVCLGDGTFEMFHRPAEYFRYAGYTMDRDDQLIYAPEPDNMAVWISQYGGSEEISYTKFEYMRVLISFPSRDISALFKLTWCQ